MSTGQRQASKSHELGQIIRGIQQGIPELFGVMIASADGLAVANNFPEADAERIAAMAATALGLGTRITERTNLGGLVESVIRGENGYLVVYTVSNDALLVLSGPIDSNLGLMRIEARSAATDIKQILAKG